MKKLTALLLVLVQVFSFASCSGNHGMTQQTGNGTEQSDVKDTVVLDEEALKDKLEEVRTKHLIAGMSVAITDGEKIIFNEGFGVDSVNAPDVPASSDSLYRIASVSKTVTAVMVLRLCEEGILDLDTPIKTYLPEFTLSKPEAAETMTLRHLLTHTAGMPADDYMSPGSRDESTINDVIRKALPNLQISSLPSEGKYQYSTWGYMVIGFVASTVTGKSLSQLVSEYVLDPLGMDATTFDYQVASNSEYPLSLPHLPIGIGNHCVDGLLINTAFNAGAGLYSNTADLCKLSRFFLNGGVTDSGERLLSEQSLEDMLTHHTERSGGYYGLGVILRSFNDRYIYGHTGTYYGRNYRCSFFVDEKTGYGVITLLNSPGDGNTHITIPEMIFHMLES